MNGSNAAPPLTPDQLIALLQKLCAAGFCATRFHQGDQIYMLSAGSIQNAREILQSGAGGAT